MANEPQIEIFDDLLTYVERERLYEIARTAQYHICGADDTAIENQKDYSIVCDLDLDLVYKLGILDLPQFEHLKGRQCHGRINISTPTDSDRIHTDGMGTTTLIYYVNLNWDLEWQGFTIFTDDNKKEVIRTVEYVPGRFVLFDGGIPHKVCSPSTLAPTFRMTLTINFR